MDAFRKYYSKFQDLKFKMTMDTFKELEESGKNRRRQCLGLSLKTFIDPSESHQNSGLAETTDQTNTTFSTSTIQHTIISRVLLLEGWFVWEVG